MVNYKKNIVCIGGGTGTYTVLSGLKKYPFQLNAIITMMDSGGSSGKLRDQLGVLPPGDLRQALIALSECEREWRDLFLYRFSEGDLYGHNFGNLFISALEKSTGSLEKALQLAAQLLRSKGNVFPVTFENVQLCVELVNGNTIIGETHIDETSIHIKRPPIRKVFLRPVPKANKRAISEIMCADGIIIGPGDLYTSILPNLLVPEISKALKKTKAKIIIVVNLMTKYGQTDRYTALKHVQLIEKQIGKLCDIVVINSEKPPKKELQWYKKHKETVVLDNFTNMNKNSRKIIRTKLLSKNKTKVLKSDILRRSLVRHDSDRLATVLSALL
jgi:uncharacterized cofD-like protein